MMKKTYLIVFVSILILMACSLTIPSTWAAGKPIKLRVTMAQPPMDPMVIDCVEMTKRFNQRAGGAYEMEIFAGEQLCKLFESPDAVRTGAIEMCNIGFGVFGSDIKEEKAAEMPFLYDSVAANAASQRGIMDAYSDVLIKKLNQKPLGSYSVSTMNLISSKPVKTIEDWKGLVIQADNISSVSLIKGLGGSSVVIPYPEVYSALDKGVVDGGLLVPDVINVMKIYEVTKYYTVFHPLGTCHAFTINCDVWGKMPQNIKDVLAEEVDKVVTLLNDRFVNDFEKQLQILTEKGIEVYRLSRAERDKWRAKIIDQTNQDLKTMGEIGMKIKQVADEANKKYPYPYQ